ncbi:MAG TPA: hypothetical protein GX736_01495 [Mogibacterium sp.]|nr:hypothetical protein [Mogibacterium sp.]
MIKKNPIMKFVALAFYVVIPNVIATLMPVIGIRSAIDFTSMSDYYTDYFLKNLIAGAILSVLIICVIFPEIHWLSKGDISSAILIPTGLALNLVINAMPILLAKDVPIILSLTYLTVKGFYTVLTALLITAILLLVFKKRKT